MDNVATKVCSLCKEEFPLSGTYWTKDSSKSSGFDKYCRTCKAQKRNQWRKENAEQWNESAKLGMKRHKLMKRYGITLLEWETQLALQDKVCALCREPTENRWLVDYDTVAKKMRSILCGSCWWKVSNAERRPEKMMDRIDDPIIQYILNPPVFD